jgi:hypothetical protein
MENDARIYQNRTEYFDNEIQSPVTKLLWLKKNESLSQEIAFWRNSPKAVKSANFE